MAHLSNRAIRVESGHSAAHHEQGARVLTVLSAGGDSVSGRDSGQGWTEGGEQRGCCGRVCWRRSVAAAHSTVVYARQSHRGVGYRAVAVVGLQHAIAQREPTADCIHCNRGALRHRCRSRPRSLPPPRRPGDALLQQRVRELKCRYFVMPFTIERLSRCAGPRRQAGGRKGGCGRRRTEICPFGGEGICPPQQHGARATTDSGQGTAVKEMPCSPRHRLSMALPHRVV